MIKDFDSTRWLLAGAALLMGGILTGCAHSPKSTHHHSSLISPHRVKDLTRPPAPAYYVVSEHFYGYYGTCWRPWPAGWEPCVEPCTSWPVTVTDHPLSPEIVPLPPTELAPPWLPPEQPPGASRGQPQPPARELPPVAPAETGRPLLSDFFR